MGRAPTWALRQPPPPPPRRCSDGSVSFMLSKEEGYSNTSMVGDKCLYLDSRTRPYYLRRCKRVRSTNMESLPDELLLEILARLPADYLYDRARVVCRRWYHLIHSDAFINTQLQHSTYGLLLSWYHHPIFVTATQGRIETSEFPYKVRPRFLSSCNGLAVQLDFINKTPTIINPATKQPFVVPSLSCEEIFHQACGIGYAAASMEYKVALPHRTSVDQVFLAILTVGSDKSWRHVRVEHLSESTKSLLCQFPLITEGFMHWSAPEWFDYLTLDMETEILTWGDFPLPQACQLTTIPYYLSTGRSLSLLVAHRDTNFVFELWEMKPETGEWTKLLADIKLGAHKRRLRQFARGEDVEPLGWVKYPEVLALHLSHRHRTCIFFNLNTHEIISTELPSPCPGSSAIVHKNSLTWLS